LYLNDQESGKRVHLQTQPFYHARGIVNQDGRLVLPLDRQSEPYLYQRVRAMEENVQSAMVFHLAGGKESPYQAPAQKTLAAWQNYQRNGTWEPEEEAVAYPMRGAYNASDTLWLNVNTTAPVFGPDNQPLEGNLAEICKAGRYELLIRVLSVFMDGSRSHKWAFLQLRVIQIRYEAAAAVQAEEINQPLFLPPFQIDLPLNWDDMVQTAILPPPRAISPKTPTPTEVEEEVACTSIASNPAAGTNSPNPAVGTNSLAASLDDEAQDPWADLWRNFEPTCAPLASLSDEEEPVAPIPTAPIPTAPTKRRRTSAPTNRRRAPLPRKRKEPKGLTFVD
jgi:hypothetical protein